MFKRTEYEVIKRRLEEPRRFIQVVMGPRQVGKSTVVKQVLQDSNLPYQLFSADNVPATNTAWVSNCWAAVRSLKDSKGWESVILVIDEINKNPTAIFCCCREQKLSLQTTNNIKLQVRCNHCKRNEDVPKLTHPRFCYIAYNGLFNSFHFHSFITGFYHNCI